MKYQYSNHIKSKWKYPSNKTWMLLSATIFGATGFVLFNNQPIAHADTNPNGTATSQAPTETTTVTSDTNNSTVNTVYDNTLDADVTQSQPQSAASVYTQSNTQNDSVYIDSNQSNNVTSVYAQSNVTTSQSESYVNSQTYNTTSEYPVSNNTNYQNNNQNNTNTVPNTTTSGASSSNITSISSTPTISARSVSVNNYANIKSTPSLTINKLPSSSLNQLSFRDTDDEGAQSVYNQNGVTKYTDGAVKLESQQMNHMFTTVGLATASDTGVTLTSPGEAGVGAATFNSAINLQNPFHIYANFRWSNADGIGLMLYPANEGFGKTGKDGGNLGIIGLPNVYGFKIDTYVNSDDAGAPSTNYATFEDTNSNGDEIGVNGETMHDTWDDGTNEYINQAVDLGDNKSGIIQFDYTPIDNQSGTYKVTLPNGQTMQHTITFDPNNPTYYFSTLGSGDVATGTQAIEYHNIYYTPGQTAVVNVVDSVTNQTLKTFNFNGKIGQVIDPNNTIMSYVNGLINQGYGMVSNGFTNANNTSANTLNSDGSVATNSNLSLDGVTPYSDNQVHFSTNVTTLNPVYTITLNHGYKTVDETRNLSRQINYVDGDENNSEIPNNPAITQTITETNTKVYDKLSNAFLGYSSDGSSNVTSQNENDTWRFTNNVNTFPSVASPDLTQYGYTKPDISTVPADSRADTSNGNNAAPITVTYHHKIILVNGTNPMTTGQTINANINGGNITWPSVASANNLSKTITRTINYVDSQQHQLLPSTIQTVNYYRNVGIDAVTGQPVGYSIDNGQSYHTDNDNKYWTSPNNQFQPVTNPDLSGKGYNPPSQASEANEAINYDGQNETITVVYTDALLNEYENKTVTQTINYLNSIGKSIAPSVSDTTNFKLTKVYDKVKKAIIGYSLHHNTDVDTTNEANGWQATNNDQWPDHQSPDLSNLGYNPPSQNDVPSITVNYTSPNRTINITYTDGMKNEYANQTIHRTINYLNQNNQTLLPSITDSTSFQLTKVIDKVTNQLMGYSLHHNITVDTQNEHDGWQPTNSNQWPEHDSISMSDYGYKAPTISVVPSKTPTIDTKDEIINVIYPDDTIILDYTNKNKIGQNINPKGNAIWNNDINPNNLHHVTTQTINYLNTSGAVIAPKNVQTAIFNRLVEIDKVTGETLGYLNNTNMAQLVSPLQNQLAWQPQSETFKEIYSPNLFSKGYLDPTADAMNSVVVNYETPSDDINIIYRTHARIVPESKVITETTHYQDQYSNDKLAPDVIQTVTYHRNAIYTDGQNKLLGYTTIPNQYEIDYDPKQGNTAWVTNYNQFNTVPIIDFSNDNYINPTTQYPAYIVNWNTNNIDQIYKYGHAIEIVTPDENLKPGDVITNMAPHKQVYPNDIAHDNLVRQMIRTIHYQDATNNNQISPDVIQIVTYTRNAVIDKVTGKLIGWSLGNTRYDDITSPNDGDNAWHTDDDQWATAISPNLSNRGYINPSMHEVMVKSIRYNDGNADVIIKYTHGAKLLNPETKIITRTINYLDTQTRQPLEKSIVEKVEYHRNPIIDAVTNQLIGYGNDNSSNIAYLPSNAASAWLSDNSKWGWVDSPQIDNYILMSPEYVTSENVAADNPNVNIDIWYQHKLAPVKKQASVSQSVTASVASISNSASNEPVSYQASAAINDIPIDTNSNVNEINMVINSAHSSVSNNSDSDLGSNMNSVGLSMAPSQYYEISIANDSIQKPTEQFNQSNLESKRNQFETSNSKSISNMKSNTPQMTQILTAIKSLPTYNQSTNSKIEPHRKMNQSTQLPQTSEKSNVLPEIGELLIAIAALLKKKQQESN